jgi:hypothetical protein
VNYWPRKVIESKKGTSKPVSDNLVTAKKKTRQIATKKLKGMFGSNHIVAPPNIWLTKILVVLLVVHDLANIGKKSKLYWLKSYWHAK